MKKYFIVLALIILIIFHNAFTIYFFNDDFFFLNISHIHNFQQFLNFFNPIRDYFYRPISSELFYFLIQLFHNNVIIAHSIVFATFFIGIIFLYKVLTQFFDKNLSKLIVFVYAIHFTHVFQLYWLATFQEISLFTFLIISFYFFLKKKNIFSCLFFILALLSKETAMMYPVFILVFILLNRSYKKKQFLLSWGSLSIFLIPFLYVYSLSISRVKTLPEYAIHLAPNLFINNVIWYSLWSIGLPNFMPDYMPSIISKPLPEFWHIISPLEYKIYFVFLLAFILSFTLGIVIYIIHHLKTFTKRLPQIVTLLLGFIIFLAPTLFIIHKWMVRLTIPVIFVTIIISYVVYYLYKSHNQILRILGVLIGFFYILFNIFAVRVHEISSVYQESSMISRNAVTIFTKNNATIIQKKSIYIQDSEESKKLAIPNSKRIESVLGEQSAMEYLFPDNNIHIFYNFQQNKPMKNTFLINSSEFWK